MSTSCHEFEVMVHTSPGPTCGTFSRLWLNLIGSHGETPPLSVCEDGRLLLPGSVCPVRVRVSTPLGRLLLVRLQLEARTGFPDLDWHCSRVEVRSMAVEDQRGGRGACPGDSDVQVFLCDRWLRTADGDIELRSGKLCLLNDETEEKLKQQRIRQLEHQRKLIRWREFVEGAPRCVDLNSLTELGPNLRNSSKSPAANLHYVRGFAGRAESWTSFSELETVFSLIGHENNTARFVQAHWAEDWYFGYQTLNGCNPLLLRQTSILPPNLPVTSDMLRPFLPDDSSLEQELQTGHMFLLDYEVLDGVPANVINGKQTYLSAPLCLLHLNQRGQLIPIAIQLQQTPSPNNPLFLPSDPGCDWLLAKIFVRCADFQCHQIASHYLRTHMLGELCCVSTLRQLPEPHPLHQILLLNALDLIGPEKVGEALKAVLDAPLFARYESSYQLLMPHIRTSLQINFQARVSLLAADGVFDKAVGCGLKGLHVLLSRASDRISYQSMCVPDDLAARGVDKLPQSFYAEDALRVWDALHRFVLSWVSVYYSGDDEVQQDSELQHWLSDINAHGFNNHSGFPLCFRSKAEVCKFITMIIFSCSALHAAVNFSQLDFALWMPNCPAYMLRPPPQVKGQVTEDDIMSFLPHVNSTCRVLTALTLLSQPAVNFVPLCQYTDAIFRDDAHCRLLEEVQAELKAISDDIIERNRQLSLPYPYLDPEHIENSVAI